MKRLFVLIAALTSLDLAASDTPASPPSTKGVVLPAALATPHRADLKITAKPHNGYGLLYDFKIENVGNLPSKEAGIQFWVTPPCARPAAQANLGPGKLILTGTFKGLVVTTSPQYAFSYSFEMPAFYMGCAIKVIVDPDHHLVEVTRDNNEVIVQTVLPPAPDLVVSYWIEKFTVKNQGNAAAGSSVAHVGCTSTLTNHPCDPQGGTNHKTWTYNVPALAPGQQHTFDSPIAHQYKDSLTAIADVNHQVPESNENNNMWTPY